jgi:hypothetical protein
MLLLNPRSRSGAGDETRTRDIQLGRKEGMQQTPCAFKESLDADMAHFLWLANVFLRALQ